MSILIGVGIVTTVSVIYVARKGWHALHKAVGITPGVLVYQDIQNNAQPLALKDMRWRQLSLQSQHLTVLTQQQLRQLQRIDEQVVVYNDYQQNLKQQNITAVFTEQQFVLHKLLHTRLPEMLASHYHLVKSDIGNKGTAPNAENTNQQEARQLLQAMLDNIETKLASLLAQMQSHHLQDLRVMKNYMDSHG